MGSNGGRTDPPLKEALFDRGYEFEFFQAARLLARLFPHRKSVGSTSRPADEFARFVTIANGNGLDDARLSMAFPASAVHDIERSPDSPDDARMTVAFMSLTGTQGVLPFYYTERILASKAAKDNALAAFFDLFNHRLVSLFYLGQYSTPIFEFAHLYLWEMLIIIDAMVVFGVWVKGAAQK